jgi:methylmalonyl-CoA mutase, N-terminal domain
MDEALGLPTEKAVTIALRTQQIIANESGVADTIDPMAGSFFVESLTSELEKSAYSYIDRIENLGGVVKCIETGWIQREIQQAAYTYQRAIESKEEIVVGVNDFVQKESDRTDVLKISEAVANEQISRLKSFKARRDQNKENQQLQKIKKAAQGTENLMPLFVDAVEANVTLGEISNTLREVFGLYKETITI